MSEVETYDVYRQDPEADCSDEFVGALDLPISEDGDCVHKPLEIEGVIYIPQV